ncbi:kinase-like domain-containing protein, partial [Russula dissimulans]
IPVGRWTRLSIAYDVEKGRPVFLKDSWRVLLKGIQAEGEIYRRLHDNNVPNIPPCLLSSDVGDDTYHASQTHEIVHEHITHHTYPEITSHRHYRIVLGVIGKQLENFDRSWEVVNAMHAALKAHEAAYNAGVLHRDISTGNILIAGPAELADRDDQFKPKIEGRMLIDWDLSSIVNDSITHHYARTGTWQFLAADLVELSNVKQTYVHDLESFFWVLLWI